MSLWSRHIDSQYRQPRGIIGWWIGRRMMRQHHPENVWTIDTLNLAPTDSVLEVGFGPGLAIREAAARVSQGRVAGIDFSAAMVRMAKRLNAAAVRAGRVDLRRGDAHSLPFADQSFDKAYTIHSIYFWHTPDQALRELHRVIKRGGIVALTILPKERFNAADPDTLNTPTFRAYSGSDLQTLLAAAGFAETWIEDDPTGICASNYTVMGRKG